MNQNNKFAQLARRITNTGNLLREPELFHAAREWRIGLVIALLIFIASAAWSAQTYISLRDSSSREIYSVEEEVVVYREALVEAALAVYQERSQAHVLLLQKFQATPAPVATSTAANEATQPENGVIETQQTEDEQFTTENPLLETEIASTTEGDTEPESKPD